MQYRQKIDARNAHPVTYLGNLATQEGMMRGLTLAVVCLLLFFPACLPTQSGESTAAREAKIKERLFYLETAVDGIQWFEVSNNNVYVGFGRLPQDWNAVIRAAALHCNRAIDFGCHVWAVNSDHRGWRPGAGPYYGEVTARYGKIEQ